MVDLTNSYVSSSGGAPILVTWSSTYPSPFNTDTYATGQVNGTPFQQGTGS